MVDPTADPAPFIPALCTGCAHLAEGCSKLALVRDLHGDVEIADCGLYSPTTPPADPAQE